MSKWYEKKYINRFFWIMEEFESLTLSAEEGMLVLLIEYFNEAKIPVNYATLAEKMKMDIEKIDEMLSLLTEKGYLKISMNNRAIEFNLDGIFEKKEEQMNFNGSLFETFESEFARPLTQIELQRLSDWITTYELKLITYALREAVIYNKKSFEYIERILVDWKRRDLSVERIENGER